MSVFRVVKNKNYTVMSNHHLRDKNLSYKAKGMLSYMLSLPDDWDYSINGLVAVSKEQIKAIRSVIKELEENHYIERTKRQRENGTFYYDYNIYEYPYNHNGHTDEVHTDKDLQQITNKESTNNKDKLDKLNINVKKLIEATYIEETELDLYRYEELYFELSIYCTHRELAILTSYFINQVKNKTISNNYVYLKESLYSNIKKIRNEEVPDWFEY